MSGHLLRITVSRRGSTSHSLNMLDEFTNIFSTSHPDVPIITRSTYEIPHLSYDEHEAGRTKPEQQTSEVAGHYKLAAELTSEVLNARHIVIATPMYDHHHHHQYHHCNHYHHYHQHHQYH